MTPLTRASVQTGRLEPPPPGDDQAWLLWLRAILPYADLPLVAPQVSSVTLLPALATRFSPWLVRGSALVRFAWPRLEKEPVLNHITALNAMLMGLNGFYLGRNLGNALALAQLRQAIEQAETASSPAPAVLPHALPPADPPGPIDPDIPSFSDLWRPQ